MTTQHASITALFDRLWNLEATPHDLKQLTEEQLTHYQKGIAAHVGTPNEAKARQMNRMINDEKHRRSGYGD